MNSTTNYISVVVCTYNRSEYLKTCLDSLVNQTLDQCNYEIIVVDNNSKDKTRELVRGYADQYQNIKLVYEERQGLSFARNRGWSEAAGGYVAYIDDDAKACRDWLGKMVSFIGRNPEAAVFGGPYDAFSERELPAWFPPEYGRWFLPGGERILDIDKGEFLKGTNMIYRKDLLQALGGFNPALGMVANEISYGEETRFQIDLQGKGVPIYYLPDMKVCHCIQQYKIRLGWLCHSTYRNGRCSTLTLNAHRSFANHLGGVAVGLVRLVKYMIQPQLMPIKRRIYYAASGLIWEFGALVDCLETRVSPIVRRQPR